MIADEELERIKKENEKRKKYLEENVWLYDQDGKAVVFSKTYLAKRNIMGWVYDQEEKKYVRTKRIIHSKFWLAIHNLIAHPMLVFYRPWGEWLHEYTAERMYAGPQRIKDEDIEVTAVTD